MAADHDLPHALCRRSYRLHFYLENGTCEILENPTKNSGRDIAPVFLRRSLLPKVRHTDLYWSFDPKRSGCNSA